MPDRVYLDHAATTPLLPVARAAMLGGFDLWANPSSPHQPGRAARAAMERARRDVADALGWSGDVVFTSGASESIAIAIGRSRADRVLVASVEHEAVLRATVAADRVPVDRHGQVSPDDLRKRLDCLGATCPLVAIQSANSETGVLQPLEALRDVVRAAGGVLFVDASQSAGKIALPAADLIAVSAHKLGGPPGVGALLVRDLGTLEAGGGQEQGYRAGTENLPAVLGFAAALAAPRDWLEAAKRYRRQLDDAIVGGGGQVVALGSERLPTVTSYRMPGVSAAAQLIRFDLAGIAVSAGSACSSGSLSPSHVLAAMGWDAVQAREVVRVSFGASTTIDEIDRFIDVWQALADEAQRRAA